MNSNNITNKSELLSKDKQKKYNQLEHMFSLLINV